MDPEDTIIMATTEHIMGHTMVLIMQIMELDMDITLHMAHIMTQSQQ